MFSSKLLLWAPVSHTKNERARWEEPQGPCKYSRCDIYEMKGLEMVVKVAESRNSRPKPAFSLLGMHTLD